MQRIVSPNTRYPTAWRREGYPAPSLPVFPGSGRSGPRSLACDCHAHDCVRLSSGRDPCMSALRSCVGRRIRRLRPPLRTDTSAPPAGRETWRGMYFNRPGVWGFHHAFRSSFSRRRSRASLRRGERGSPGGGDARRTALSGRAGRRCRGLAGDRLPLDLSPHFFVPRGVVG